MTPSTIAIDGPSASGKSTLGERLAERLGYLYFDTGLLYRAITWEALVRGIDIADQAAVTHLAESIRVDIHTPEGQPSDAPGITVDGKDVTSDIRRPEVDRNVSAVSSYRGVREAANPQFRRIAARGCVIMAGRDIGTVVLPDADLKIYLDASADARAQRRLLERESRGEHISLQDMKREIEARDRFDSTREVAPLRRADDAVLLDNTGLDIEATVERALEIIRAFDPAQAKERRVE